MFTVFKQFKNFCETPNRTSGKAVSYAHAMQYLCDFLDISIIDEQAIQKLHKFEKFVRDDTSNEYMGLLNFLIDRNQSSYLTKGFIKAALPAFFRFYSYNLEAITINATDSDFIISQEMRDSNINVEFNNENLRRELPIPNDVGTHIYSVSRTHGTARDSLNKIRSGRKAEKYFMEFLKSLGFICNQDYKDVANDKDYGFDLLLFNVGLEIKNIKNGGFYLSDSEIAYLQNQFTHLILVDLNNGIWLLRNNANWLKNIISNIQAVREYCKTIYKNLDLTDIKINLDESLKTEIVDMTCLTKQAIIDLFVEG